MTLGSEQWCALRWLVNLNSGLRPKLSRLVSVFGVSERLIQKMKWRIVRFQWNLGVSWCYGLVVRSVKFSLNPVIPIKFNKKTTLCDYWRPTCALVLANESICKIRDDRSCTHFLARKFCWSDQKCMYVLRRDRLFTNETHIAAINKLLYVIDTYRIWRHRLYTVTDYGALRVLAVASAPTHLSLNHFMDTLKPQSNEPLGPCQTRHLLRAFCCATSVAQQ